MLLVGSFLAAKIPQMFNYCLVGRGLTPYDLLWPVSKRLDAGVPDLEAKVVEGVGLTNMNHSSMSPGAAFFLSISQLLTDESHLFRSGPPSSSLDDTLESVRSYAASLLATLPNAKGKSPDDASSDGADNSEAGNGKYNDGEGQESWKIEQDGESADEGGLTGCREAVELLTRNQRKGMANPSFFYCCRLNELLSFV